jgi:hypothetical protein
MPTPPKPPLNFNPAAALMLGEQKATFTITVNLKTGQMEMVTDRPDMNFLAVIDLLLTQAQGIVRRSLAEAFKGNPGFSSPDGKFGEKNDALHGPSDDAA